MQPGTQLAMAVLYHLGLDRRANYPSVLDVVQRAAAQSPRPGRWIEDGCCVVDADGITSYEGCSVSWHNFELLNQGETDMLIAVEARTSLLLARSSMATVDSVIPWPYGGRTRKPFLLARAQRGGLHSDPRIRAVALALWGDRDVGIPRAEYERRRAS